MTDSAAESGDAGTMRGRAAESSWKLWALLNADRWLVTAGILAGFFGVLVLVSAFAPVPLRRVLGQSDPNETLFQALVTAIITGVTLVVTITQLVISQELGAAGDQRERMEGAMQFRADAADLIDANVSPPEPAAFLQSLVDATRTQADALATAVEDTGDVWKDVNSYTDGLEANAAHVNERLADAEFGTFEVLHAALDYNYSWKIYEGKRLQTEYGDVLTDDADEALDDLLETLRLFGPAREHIKTLYFQWELINLSRSILYAAVPALVVAIAGVLFLDTPGTIIGTTLGVDNLVWVVSAATTIALAPFVILLAYVLRIATIAKRTLAIGPFVLRETDRSETIEWDDTE
ncbi:hypothetical protein [Salinibaculum rarum]|uniref:hypothetical protein n=1 Tax=Salinibaculum rarum TaxID=3058903 RepID=UPI00265FC0E8|nr:hypothetical protein [Salinibaculum sp. KK48]